MSALIVFCLILYCCPRLGLCSCRVRNSHAQSQSYMICWPWYGYWRPVPPIRVSLETLKGVEAKKVIFLRGASTPLDFVSLTYGSPTRFFLSEHTYLSLYGADRNAHVHTVGPGFAPTEFGCMDDAFRSASEIEHNGVDNRFDGSGLRWLMFSAGYGSVRRATGRYARR
jgi:hypothetical protein